LDRDLTFKSASTTRARTSTEKPAISSIRADDSTELLYGSGLAINALGTGTVTSNSKQFVVHLVLDVRVNGKSFFSKTWLKTVPRYFI
jgi:hypothetical protein